MLKITENKVKKIQWEKFNLASSYPSIFQSWNIGESDSQRGINVTRLALYSGSKLTGIIQMLTVIAKRGTFFHIRGGPVLHNLHDLSYVLSYLKTKAKTERVSFIRISPPILTNDSSITKYFNKLGLRKSPIPLLDAECAWVLDITPTTDAILKQMRKTTRYLIKKSLDLGVKIKISQSQKDCDNLLTLYTQMTKHKNITPHTGIREEFTELVKDDQVVIISGYYRNQLLGSALIIFYGQEAIYHHSAHKRTPDNIPIAYAIQWAAIQEARKRGCRFYNFWGIEPTGNPRHPWAGLTLFKKGFGGSMRDFIGTYDYPLNITYLKTWLIEEFRKVTKYRS